MYVRFVRDFLVAVTVCLQHTPAGTEAFEVRKLVTQKNDGSREYRTVLTFYLGRSLSRDVVHVYLKMYVVEVTRFACSKCRMQRRYTVFIPFIRV